MTGKTPKRVSTGRRQRGTKNGKWAGGVCCVTDGYLQIRAGPLRGVYVHHLVAEAMIGRPLTKGEEVHHLNGDRLDPRPANLQVLTRAEHMALHRDEDDRVQHALEAVADDVDDAAEAEEIPF